MRSLEPWSLETLKTGILKKIVAHVKKDEDLLLLIRKNALNIYCNCGSVAKISFINNTRTHQRIRVDVIRENDYFTHDTDGTARVMRDKVSQMWLENEENVDTFLEFIQVMQPLVKSYMNGTEKEIQQQIFLKGNMDSSQNFFYLDIEYNIEGISGTPETNNSRPGRADMIAISLPQENTFKIMFVEVKRGSLAYRGAGISEGKFKFGSGVVGHMLNYVKMINNNIPEIFETHGFQSFHEYIAAEIKNLVFQYEELGLLPEHVKSLTYKTAQLKSTDFLFYMMDYDENNKTFEKYLGTVDGSSKYNVKRFLSPTEIQKVQTEGQDQLHYLTRNDLLLRNRYYKIISSNSTIPPLSTIVACTFDELF